jgi:Uma2 family endonuclease
MMQSHSPGQSSQRSDGAQLSYRITGFSDHWIIPEEPVPEAAWHDGCLELFKALLVAWVERTRRDAAVFRDMAVLAKRERPRVGFNPDVCLVEPSPPRATELESLKLWEATSPLLTFEAVSPNHPYKDYAIIPEKCAVTGVGELIVFDPLLAGPRAQGGPHLLQLWQQLASGGFERVYAGDGPVRSLTLDAWLLADPVVRRVRIAARADGGEPWLTKEEQAVADRDRATESLAEARQRESEARRREDEARQRESEALARLAALEAELANRGSPKT